MREAPQCPGCDWDTYTRDNPTSGHVHSDAEDGPREGCCAHTCDRILTFDEAESAGLDGTGRDGDPRFPYHLSDVAAMSDDAMRTWHERNLAGFQRGLARAEARHDRRQIAEQRRLIAECEAVLAGSDQ